MCGDSLGWFLGGLQFEWCSYVRYYEVVWQLNRVGLTTYYSVCDKKCDSSANVCVEVTNEGYVTENLVWMKRWDILISPQKKQRSQQLHNKNCIVEQKLVNHKLGSWEVVPLLMNSVTSSLSHLVFRSKPQAHSFAPVFLDPLGVVLFTLPLYLPAVASNYRPVLGFAEIYLAATPSVYRVDCKAAAQSWLRISQL